jgi:rhodanese-related sulfurtransferase
VDYTPREVSELIEREDVQLIDVRTPAEVEAGRIAGSTHIELTQLQSQLDAIDRERPIVFYCRAGGRSAMATEAFRGAGFDASNMSGGLLEWAAEGLPLDPPDGHVAEH